LIFQEGNSGRIKEEEDRVVGVAIRWVHVAEDRCMEEDRVTHVVECKVGVVEETSKEPHIIITSSSPDLTGAEEAELEEEVAITRISHGIRTSLLTTMHQTRRLWIVLTVVIMMVTSGIVVHREEGKRLLGHYTGKGFLTIIPRARMGPESIAHEAKGLRGYEGERNNCFSKI